MGARLDESEELENGSRPSTRLEAGDFSLDHNVTAGLQAACMPSMSLPSKASRLSKVPCPKIRRAVGLPLCPEE